MINNRFFTLVFAIFFTVGNIIAQSKCEKVTYSNTDDFTNEKVIGTKSISLVNCFTSPCIFISAQNKNGIDYLTISAISSDIFSIREGDKILIKAKNGKILELNWQENLTADYRIIETLNNAVEWRIRTKIKISKETLIWLSENEVAKVRWEVDGYYFEKETKEKQAKNIKNIITCFLTKLN